MCSDLAQRLLEHVEGERSAMLALLERLVRTESPSNDPAAQAEILGHLQDALVRIGFTIRHLDGPSGPHLYARPRGRVRPATAQLVLGHCDTVWPRGTLETMPWQVDGDVARGPGIYDMKAGLVQMLFALRALQALGIEHQVTPLVFVNSDEEIGSRSSTRHITRLAQSVERVFVLEPSLGPEGKLKTTRKGTARLTVRITGRAAHAGLEPGAGASAILELSYVVQALFALNDPGRGISVNVGMIDGGLRPNVVAPESRAVIDLRVERTTDGEEVIDAMKRITPRNPDVQIEIEGALGRPPLEPTARNRALFEKARQHAKALGLDVGEATAGGASDGNTTSRFTATLDGLGAVGDGAHARHEHIFVHRLIERTALLALLLQEPPLGRRAT